MKGNIRIEKKLHVPESNSIFILDTVNEYITNDSF